VVPEVRLRTRSRTSGQSNRLTRPLLVDYLDALDVAVDDVDRYGSATLLIARDDGPALTQEQEDALQDAHMAHLADLHAKGILLVAGPLTDPDSSMRGLSILKVGVDEARALKEADPAVVAGVYRIVALPWLVPGGAMSFAAARFPRSMREARGD
jgi:uncharacterized protein YciI